MARQKTAAEPGIVCQSPDQTQEISQEGHFYPPLALSINYGTLIDGTQVSPATSPPLSEELDNNGPEDAETEKGDWSLIEEHAKATLASADQLEQEMTEALHDGGVESEENTSTSSSSAYNEAEDSVFIVSEPPTKTPVARAKPAKPVKQSTGVRRAAKVVTPREIAENMGGKLKGRSGMRTDSEPHTDIAITAFVKMKPFNEKAKLDSSDSFFDVRDKIARVLNRRSQDLTLGYFCSWWMVKAQASPNSLRDEEAWEGLVEEIKLWLAGDKKRPGNGWSITVMDKEDAEGSGKVAAKAANEKKVCINRFGHVRLPPRLIN
jgi:hypothetical protein